MKENSFAMALNSLKIESEAIGAMCDMLDRESFELAVSHLRSCGKVILSGCGGSGIALRKFAHSLRCIEKDACFLPTGEALHGGLGLVKAADVVFLFSRGGSTTELIPIAKAANQKHAVLLVMTEQVSSPLAQLAQLVIPISIPRETDRYDVMTTTSFAVASALFDSLFIALMEEMEYPLARFAADHPGGAVGARLNGAD